MYFKNVIYSLSLMLKVVWLLNMFVETMLWFFRCSLMNRSSKKTAFFLNINLFLTINILTANFDQLNESLMNKSIKLFKIYILLSPYFLTVACIKHMTTGMKNSQPKITAPEHSSKSWAFFIDNLPSHYLTSSLLLHKVLS